MDHMLVDDNSTDLDALRDDLKFEMVVLHTEVKKLDPNWDFSGIIKPLMDDQGPPILVIPRIKKQIERMQKLTNGIHTKTRDLQRPAAALAEAAQSLYVAEHPNTKTKKKKERPVQPKPQPTEPRCPRLPPQEELPPWGDCKRYCAMPEEKYKHYVEIARQIYDQIQHSTEPKRFQQKELTGKLLSAVTCRWLAFQNIKDAALTHNFSLIKIGYNRNEALLAAKAEADPDRQAFVEWAVNFLRTNTTDRKISKQALLSAWTNEGGKTYPRSYFTASQGTPLNMEKLRMQAFPNGGQAFPNGQRRPAASGSDDDGGPGGSGEDSDCNPDGSEWLNDDESLTIAPASGEARTPAQSPGSRLLCQDVPAKRCGAAAATIADGGSLAVVGAAASASSASSDAAIEQNRRDADLMKAIENYLAVEAAHNTPAAAAARDAGASGATDATAAAAAAAPPASNGGAAAAASAPAAAAARDAGGGSDVGLVDTDADGGGGGELAPSAAAAPPPPPTAAAAERNGLDVGAPAAADAASAFAAISAAEAAAAVPPPPLAPQLEAGGVPAAASAAVSDGGAATAATAASASAAAAAR
jgi:hypothetical protein